MKATPNPAAVTAPRMVRGSGTAADVSGQLSFSIANGINQKFTALQLQSVSAVPEPLTILGAVTAAGFGVAFKRKLAKSQKGQEDA